MKRAVMWTLRLSALLFLAACGSEIETPGEELRLLGRTLEPAFLGEPYSADIPVVGGLAPYGYEVSAGELPPGLALQGNTIRGTPTEEGSYRFTVTVSDANLSKTFQEFTLNVTEPPPAEFNLNVPETEMQSAFFLRGQVTGARELQAFRTAITWDPRRFELVPGSLRATRNGLALFFEESGGNLNVDVAVLAGNLSGEHNVFEFQLRPVAGPSTILVTARTEFLSADGDHAFATLRDGRQPAQAVADEDAEEDGQPDGEPEGEENEEGEPNDANGDTNGEGDTR